MRRIRCKRKPPKIKQKVYDGTSFKTKYVRMAPLSTTEMKREGESTSQLSEAATNNVFPIPDVHDIGSNNTRSKEKITYSEKRRKLIDAWDGLRKNLLTARLAEFSPATHTCCFCDAHVPEIIYCRDCGPNAYFCHSCHARIHKKILFHRAHQWKGSMYVPLLLTNELSRTDHFCETVYSSTIYAVDVKGTQHICNVALCRCEDPAVTLLRYNLWPATPTNPKIAFDMRFMELLSVLQLECHLPAKTFCESLDCMHSNFINVSTFSEKNIYRAVVGDCLTEYNFHRSSLNTRNDITESTFSMECPMCLKMPPIVSLDANFGLVHKLSSGDGHGRQYARHKSSFFLDHGNLTRFVDDYSADNKPSYSDCSNFQAGTALRSKVKNKKLDITGIFGSVCKHDFPISFIDLAHGERLSYPVYMIQSILENRTDDNLVVLYDIGCMLHKHLKKTENKLVLDKCTFAVPVFHSFAHNTACQLTYGQRYAKSTGMTDGEGIERLWSYLRGFKRITKEMSLGNRQDLLTEAMLHHTEKQIWNLDRRLADKKKKCEKIVADTEKIVNEVLADLNESEEQIDIWLTDWKSMCSKNNLKACSLTADEQYAEFLHKIEFEKENRHTAETEEEKRIIETKIEKLTQECKKHRKRANNKDLTIHSDQGQILINSAKRKRQKAILMKLKELSTDRQYLSSLMKKYAEGQAIGVRISKQFSTNLNKMKKEVENFNALSNSDENIKNFLSPSSEIYDQLETRKLSEKQQKVIQAKSLLDHAKEEVCNIEIEINKYFLHLSWQSSEIVQLINYVSGLETSRDSLGKLHYLNYKHFQIEKLFNSCSKLFEDNVSGTEVPNIVHEFLQKNIASPQTSAMSSNLDMPSEEEMQEILAEVELLESVDYGADEEEDEEDDDDVEEEH